MTHLTRRDLEEGLHLVREIGAEAADPLRFARLGVERLPKLVGSEITTLSICDLAAATRSVVSNPGDAISPADRACFDHFFSEHPLVRYHSSHPDGGSRKISDSFAPRQFRGTALYNEYYRRIGIDHAIAVPLFVDRRLLVSFVLNRKGKDFSERDRAMLDLVRGYLANVYRTALALDRARAAGRALRDWAQGEGSVVVTLGPRQELLNGSAQAATLLAHYCPGACVRPGGPLPAEIAAWLNGAIHASGMTQVSALPPLQLEQEGSVLTLHAFADPDDPTQCFLLFQERCVGVSPARFAAVPVTTRERQVLAWLTAGKTDREIAAILGFSVRTIQKHLEHVYVKLGVETRTAAAMRALAMADAARPQSSRPAAQR